MELKSKLKRMVKKGLIFNIQDFSLHDGPGIRTLIFLKGCFLRCRWCSNPEGQNFKQEMLFDKRKCIKCGECIKVCKNNANSLGEVKNEIEFNRDTCRLSGDCISVCISDARAISGKWYSVSEIIDIVSRDEVFYRNSGGGVTLGGGEPTLQFEFTYALLRELKRYYINTAIETCGFIEWDRFKMILPYLDMVIFDLKHLDNKKHLEFTGFSNKRILQNLKNLLNNRKDVIVRITLIPGFNNTDEEKKTIVEFIRNIRRDTDIEFLDYHELGKFKYHLLDRQYEYSK